MRSLAKVKYAVTGTVGIFVLSIIAGYYARPALFGIILMTVSGFRSLFAIREQYVKGKIDAVNTMKAVTVSSLVLGFTIVLREYDLIGGLIPYLAVIAAVELLLLILISTEKGSRELAEIAERYSNRKAVNNIRKYALPFTAVCLLAMFLVITA